MTTWLVTRHPGAVMWAAKSGIQAENHGIVQSLDISLVADGDKVVGTLPIHLVDEVIKRGGSYFHIAMELPEEARGKELTEKQMRSYNARLEQYYVVNLGQPQSAGQHALHSSSVMLVIASGQSLPNLLPMLAMAKPVSHLYIAISASDDATVSAKKIAAVAELLAVPVTLFKNTPSAPHQSVLDFAQSCFKKMRTAHPDARIILNATGGTKMMSSGFMNALGPAGEVIYCDTANDNVEYFMPQGRAAMPLAPDLLGLEPYLMSQGQEITACLSNDPEWLETAKKRKHLTKSIIKKLDSNKPHEAEAAIRDLNKLTFEALPRKQGKTSILFTARQPFHNKGLFNTQIEELNLWTRINEQTIEFTDEAAARYLCGGWLEEYAALTMLELGVSQEHWGVGVKIRPMNGGKAKAKDDNSLNELDLAIVWRNRILVIECKTGTQLDDAKASQDILNKIEAIRSYAGGSFGTSWALSSRLIRADSNAATRANEYKITLHEREALATLRQRIAQWMRMPLDVASTKALQDNERAIAMRHKPKTSPRPVSAMEEKLSKLKTGKNGRN